jgi:hypothetical protein
MAEGVAGLKKQAAQTLVTLEKEIAQKEKELATFREEADICLQVLGKPTLSSTKGASGKRVDWKAVLSSLPQHFTAKDVMAKINKPPAAVYTQLYQMIKAGRLNRTKDGYEKL